MIVARIESLIYKKGISDAITRADAYISSGADGIMIHSKEKSPNEIIEFTNLFRQKHKKIPLFVVPTSYNDITAKQLSDIGVNVVIYANHLLRASYKAMKNTALSILANDRSREASNDFCCNVNDIIL